MARLRYVNDMSKPKKVATAEGGQFPAKVRGVRAIYETDQLGLTLRDSQRLVSARMGFFVGQHKYLAERVKIDALLPAAEQA